MEIPTKKDLVKISDYIWEIPKSFRSDMKVPARFFASEKMIDEIMRDKSLWQLVNMTTLPGIYKYSLAMPDIHEGYGACLTKESKILSNLGYYLEIEKLKNIFSEVELPIFDYSSKSIKNSSIVKFFKLKPYTNVFEIETYAGYKVRATEDHPFYTPEGMKKLIDLKENDEIAIYGFQGVPFEKPSKEKILGEKDIIKTIKRLFPQNWQTRSKIIIEKLKLRNLLPLSYDHPKLPYILKIMGFVFGDGSMNFIGKKKDGIIHFAGKLEDLEEIKKDLEILGYTSSKIYSKKYQNGSVSYSFYVNASSLVILLHSLGTPLGNKVFQSYDVPKWIFKAPLWQKRLFLASLFGCELRKPYRRNNKRHNFVAPIFPVDKSIDLIENGKKFLKNIAKLCFEFNVKATKIQIHRFIISKKEKKTASLELVFSSSYENLINLWSKIGYEYCQERKFLANVAVVYLSLKKQALEEKEKAIKITIPQLLKTGLSYQKVASVLVNENLTRRFIIDVCWKLNKENWKIKPRISTNFPSFDEFLKERTKNLGKSGFVWDKIKKITKVDYKDFVYDLTVKSENHNFIADSFLVSNCVGGIAAFDFEKGIISPGMIGFDINCLHPETKINLNFGAYLKIKNIKNYHQTILLNLENKNLEISNPLLLLRRKENNSLLKITTKFGKEILITKDHPVFTIEGFKVADKLAIGDKIVTFPFEGVEYKKPKRFLILDEEKFKEFCRKNKIENQGNKISQIIKYLKEKKLLPLYSDSEALPYILKIFGYALGDGSIDKNCRNLSIWADLENLLEIKKDLDVLKIKSYIFSRQRKLKTKSYSGKEYTFERKEFVLRVSKSFALLLLALGYPLGKKTEREFILPQWLFKLEKWQKRLFLSGFFGAELSSPITVHKYNFQSLKLNINKNFNALQNGIEFMKQIKKLLKEFDIQTSKIEIRKDLGLREKTLGLRFEILSNQENILKFFKKIGYSYHLQKEKLNNLAIAFLEYKNKTIKFRKELRAKIKNLYKQKSPVSVLINNFQGNFVNERFIERSIWEETFDVRVPFNFPSFKEFVEHYSFGDKFVVDEIEKIEEIPYKGYVYDLTINHPSHNFVANNIIVSNCGVRLLTTPFFYEEIKNQIPKLTEEIYRQVPSGVGRGGFWKLNNDEMKKVLENGAHWLREIGYANKEDLEATESYGKLEADADAVSKTAKDRGRDQLGTIGAGNHFVEIQRVAEVFNEEIAKKLGLEKNRVTVMIHCGSRGLGHQVCTDYVREFLMELNRKGIDLIDRELSYGELNSELGKQYFLAMNASANFAWANRQLVFYEIRKAFKKVFGKEIELKQVYDVAHNIAKVEEYDNKKLIVHRKGATRAFWQNHPELVSKYKEIGQPTLIPGSMGTSSYVSIGQKLAGELSFGSAPHGAGRAMSRAQAKKQIRGSELKKELENRGIAVAAGSMSGLAEEAPSAYKDVSEVVDVVDKIGIAKKVVKLVPLGVIKG